MNDLLSIEFQDVADEGSGVLAAAELGERDGVRLQVRAARLHRCGAGDFHVWVGRAVIAHLFSDATGVLTSGFHEGDPEGDFARGHNGGQHGGAGNGGVHAGKGAGELIKGVGRVNLGNQARYLERYDHFSQQNQMTCLTLEIL